MAKHAGAFRSEKRKKEQLRQKKQEDKRQKRLKKGDAEPVPEITGQEGQSSDEEKT